MGPLEDLHREFKDRGLVVVGIESWTRFGPAVLEQYREKFGITFPLLHGGPPKGYGVWVTPSVVILDGVRRPVAFMSGRECNWLELRRLVRTLLAESQ